MMKVYKSVSDPLLMQHIVNKNTQVLNTHYSKMSSITNNQAAWIPTEKGQVKVGPGPTPSPRDNEVVIEVAYAAVNPTDWKVCYSIHSHILHPINNNVFPH